LAAIITKVISIKTETTNSPYSEEQYSDKKFFIFLERASDASAIARLLSRRAIALFCLDDSNSDTTGAVWIRTSAPAESRDLVLLVDDEID
jgi:hypothetical protein